MGWSDDPKRALANWKEIIEKGTEEVPKWIVGLFGIFAGILLGFFLFKDIAPLLGKQVIEQTVFQVQQDELKVLKDQAAEFQKSKIAIDGTARAESEKVADIKTNFNAKLERANEDLIAAKTQEAWCKKYTDWVSSVATYVAQVQDHRTQLITYQTCFANTQYARQCTEQELHIRKADLDSRIAEYLSLVKPHQEQLARCFSK